MTADSAQQPPPSIVQATASESPQQAAVGPASTGTQSVQPKAAATGPTAGSQWTFGSGAPSTFGSGAPSTFGSGAQSTFGSGAPLTFGFSAPLTFGSGAPLTFGSGAPLTFGPTEPKGQPTAAASDFDPSAGAASRLFGSVGVQGSGTTPIRPSTSFEQQPVQHSSSTKASVSFGWFGRQPVQAPPSTQARFATEQQPAQSPPPTEGRFASRQQPAQPSPSTEGRFASRQQPAQSPPRQQPVQSPPSTQANAAAPWRKLIMAQIQNTSAAALAGSPSGTIPQGQGVEQATLPASSLRASPAVQPAARLGSAQRPDTGAQQTPGVEAQRPHSQGLPASGVSLPAGMQSSPASMTIASAGPTSAALPSPSTAAGDALTCLGSLPVVMHVSQADSPAIFNPFARPDLDNSASSARHPHYLLCSHTKNCSTKHSRPA